MHFYSHHGSSYRINITCKEVICTYGQTAISGTHDDMSEDVNMHACKYV